MTKKLTIKRLKNFDGDQYPLLVLGDDCIDEAHNHTYPEFLVTSCRYQPVFIDDDEQFQVVTDGIVVYPYLYVRDYRPLNDETLITSFLH